MEDYTPNSHKYKESKNEKPAVEKKKAAAVVSGNVKLKKKSEVRKFIDVFIPEDVTNVKSFIVLDVIVPAAKKAILDIIEVSLYGETGRSNRRSSTPASKVSYSRYYDKQSDRDSVRSRNSRNVYEYDDVEFDTINDAQRVIEGLDDIIETYGIASVLDFYDLSNVTGTHIDNKYGWTDLSSAKISRTYGNRYTINLPKPVAIN